jgi:tetratricopeptide (TPR) repeat protein
MSKIKNIVSFITINLFCLGLSMGTASAAQNASADAEKCLAIPNYPETKELYDICGSALKLSDLPKEKMVQLNLKMGKVFLYSYQRPLAKPYLLKAIELDPKSAQAFSLLGNYQILMGQYQEAVASYTHALELDSENLEALYQLASIQFNSQRDCSIAAANYEHVLKKDPEFYKARLRLAQMYRCIDGNKDRSFSELDKLLAVDIAKLNSNPTLTPDGLVAYGYHTMAHMQKAEVYAEFSDYEKAVLEYDSASKSYPSSSYLVQLRGEMKSKTVRGWFAALQDFNEAIKLNPNLSAAYKSKAEALVNLQSDDELIAFARSTIKSNPNLQDLDYIYLNLGWALRRKGQTLDATEAWMNAAVTGKEVRQTILYQLTQAGFIFGSTSYRNPKQWPPFNANELRNAIEACVNDEKCML